MQIPKAYYWKFISRWTETSDSNITFHIHKNSIQYRVCVSSPHELSWTVVLNLGGMSDFQKGAQTSGEM